MRIAVFASGRGTNFEKIADGIVSGKINGEIALLFTDRKEAPVIEKAKERGIEVVFLSPSKFESRESYDREILNILERYKIDLICLAGYMRIVTPVLIEPFKHRILNIHPSLLPAFPGLNVQKKAVDYGVKISGATVHIVDTGVDTGPVVVQAAVPVDINDTDKSLSEKILRWEHRIYPQAVKWFVDGRVKVVGRKVVIEGADYTSLPAVPALEDF
ncbi:phosphoribosylglycinamide formyltransferase [Desulfurobacterium atlanticum]|uniref:Phosphoribosylglycinamide formyltransferase n=1 Tax=Desulfurobacterium atlanticum TaxID=240169 RepID=A0A238Z8T5_9BACT|nr:phosphoribosylglycinamide formyltransferase [Desulfurobacterium atlanticum]SNR79896.1 phosphoribosylglycinamide formyltransferase-1 [Desulfurobacterium atlanticum]